MASGKSIEIPTLADDGLFTPEVGDWAEDKYRLVQLYATLFTKSMHGKWHLGYADLFAGAGRSRVRATERIIPASPVLALHLDPSFNRFVFCERDNARMDALERRVQRDFGHLDTRFVRGDVNENVPTILAELPERYRGQRLLTFCFVDPFGLRDLHFSTVQQLAVRQMDFLVLVPSGYDATRNQGVYLKEGNPTIDRFLGRNDWRPRWQAAKATNETFDVFMTNEFGESMKSLGYLYEGITKTQLIRSTEKRLRLYRLVLFSRHELGKKFWDEVRKYATPQRSLPY